jgi:hypothetical protein
MDIPLNAILFSVFSHASGIVLMWCQVTITCVDSWSSSGAFLTGNKPWKCFKLLMFTAAANWNAECINAARKGNTYAKNTKSSASDSRRRCHRGGRG